MFVGRGKMGRLVCIFAELKRKLNKARKVKKVLLVLIRQNPTLVAILCHALCLHRQVLSSPVLSSPL